MFDIVYTDEAISILTELKNNNAIDKLKKIKHTIDLLSKNPRHPGLHTHKNVLKGKEVFQSHIENNTIGAFRLFWNYGPKKQQITIITIIQHPK